MDKEEYMMLQNYVPGCIPIQAGDVKIGGHVLLQGIPCKVLQSISFRPRKGVNKLIISGTDIWQSKKYNQSISFYKTIMQPIIINQSYQLVNLNQQNYASILLNNGTLREDIKIQNKQFIELIHKALVENKEIFVTVTKAIGIQKISKVIIKQQEEKGEGDRKESNVNK